MLTTADVRIITQREQPVMHNQVVCTEPSPDVAKAVSGSSAISAKGGNGAVTAGVDMSASTAEALAELAGRSTALLALRDSLYQACEAYNNGTIGADAYALVLSRYPQFATTLFLAQDITGAAGAEGKAAAVSAARQAQGNDASGSPPGGGSNDVTRSADGNVKKAAGGAAPNGRSVTLTQELVGQDSTSATIRPILVAASIPDHPSHGTHAPKKTAANTDGQPSAPVSSSQSASAAPSSPVPGTSVASALALTRMNEDYMHQSLAGVLFVACINLYDQTRLSPGTNSYLEPLCKEFNYQQLSSIIESETAWAPVNPEVAAGGAAGNRATATASSPSKPPSSQKTAALQSALKRQSCASCDPGTVDGVAGARTGDALRAYQNAVGLPVNGDPNDAATLQRLGVSTIVLDRPEVGRRQVVADKI